MLGNDIEGLCTLNAGFELGFTAQVYKLHSPFQISVYFEAKKILENCERIRELKNIHYLHSYTTAKISRKKKSVPISGTVE